MPFTLQNFSEEITKDLWNLKTDKDNYQDIIDNLWKIIR